VSQMPINGAIPIGTTRLEKRGIATQVPKWNPEKCIQCGQCSFVCPHAAIRIKQIEPKNLEGAPSTFKTIKSNLKNDKELQYKVQVYPEDCTGCVNCVEACPVKDKAILMTPIEEERNAGENENVKFFESLPDNVLDGSIELTPKGTQLRRPLFEFSGACAGCGETPYVKLATQLFGDRMIIANATGCSSIYGGTFPTIPFCKNKEGKGPSWANSLFEDNAEYGFGMRLAVDANRRILKEHIELLLKSGTTNELKAALEKTLSLWDKTNDEAKNAVKDVLNNLDNAYKTVFGDSKPLLEKVIELKDYLLDKSVWIIGGDGWAYDIGFGGLDHVLAQGRNVNVLVLDTEVYSNTGGQKSKATPLGGIAKFAFAGKKLPKKNLGIMMTSYGYVYVAQINMGANKNQMIKAFLEAERFNGPSIIIAYSPCIAHGIDMTKHHIVAKNATDSGYWPLYRFNPDLIDKGENPFVLDSPTIHPELYKDFMMAQKRFSSLSVVNPNGANELFDKSNIAATHNYNAAKILSESGPKKEEKKE
jgi:pyruvate-ferredoxin/flavodoxin oxidoreductase